MHNEMLKPITKFETHLKFTPYAWAKLLHMRDQGPTEVAGYGVTATSDPLLVTDFVLVRQECTTVTFDLNAEDSAAYMDIMMDQGLMPWQYANILIHTHPGNSPLPSYVDETNFAKSFSHPNWAMMFIIAEGGECYCRLKINVGPGLVKNLDVCVDWSHNFKGTNMEAWDDEYESNVKDIDSNFLMNGREEVKDTTYGLPGYLDRQYDFPNVNDPLWYKEDENKWMRVSELDDIDHNQIIRKETETDDDRYLDFFWGTDGLVQCWSEDDDIWYTYDPITNQWYKEADDYTDAIAIASPDEKWTEQAVEWASEFIGERHLVLENNDDN